MTLLYQNLITNNWYTWIMGGLEAIVLLLVVFSMDLSAKNMKIIYIILFVINFILLIDQCFYLFTKEIRFKDIFYVMDLGICVILAALLLITIAVPKEAYFIEFSEANSNYKKLIGVLFVVKSFRFY